VKGELKSLAHLSSLLGALFTKPRSATWFNSFGFGCCMLLSIYVLSPKCVEWSKW